MEVASLERQPRKGLYVIAGRYRLEKEIGRGGAGVVHLAHDELLHRWVAVKRIGLLPGTTSDDVLRAQREARLAAGINHPNVVSIFDLVKDEDCYWLVMEHVDGRILWDPKLPDFTPAQRTALYDEMNRVIAALHAVDIERAGLLDYGKAGNYFERQIGRWSRQYRASETEREAT